MGGIDKYFEAVGRLEKAHEDALQTAKEIVRLQAEEIERLKKEIYQQSKSGFNTSVLSQSIIDSRDKEIERLEREKEWLLNNGIEWDRPEILKEMQQALKEE